MMIQIRPLHHILLAFVMIPFASAAAPLGQSPIQAAAFPSLQAALDAVPASGGLVRLPAGTFEITEPLLVQTPETRIEGAGAATHIVNKNQEGQPAIVLEPQGYANDTKKRVWRVQLADFRVSGNEKSGDGILARGVNEIYLHGVSLDRHGGNGINLIDCYEDPRISDSIITYNKKAGLRILRGHDIVVNANQFEENNDAVQCIDSFNLCMNANNLDDHLRHGVVIENTYGSVLSGNMIEECQGIAMIMDRDCYGNTVSANVLAHNFAGGVALRDAWGCTVSANTFTMDKPWGLTVGPDSGRITITGNNFSNAYIGGKTKRDDFAGGIQLNNTKHITITGNTFTGLSTCAIQAQGKCEQIIATGNLAAQRFDAPQKPIFDLKNATGIIENNLEGGQISR